MKSKNGGFSLVEVVIVVSIAAFSILAIWKIYTFYIKISLANPALFKAAFLAEEGVEAIKFMRDTSWTGNIAPLSPGAPYALTLSGNVWQAVTAPVLIDGKFDRRFTVADVNRNFSGDISDSGSLDPDTKKVVVVVSWTDASGSVKTRELTTYVSNIFNN